MPDPYKNPQMNQLSQINMKHHNPEVIIRRADQEVKDVENLRKSKEIDTEF
jgi:hypothetical protein